MTAKANALRVGGTAVYVGSDAGPGGIIKRGDRVRVVRIIGTAARVVPAGLPATSKKAMRRAFAEHGVGVSDAFLIPEISSKRMHMAKAGASAAPMSTARPTTAAATAAQRDALELIEWNERGGGGMWWHDIPAGTRDVLHRNGWIREVRAVGCTTRGCKHPGEVGITSLGVRALRRP